MCYMVYISTDCPDDLSLRSSELVRFSRPSELTWSSRPTSLTHEHCWFVGSKSECSCTFRHLSHSSVDLGFNGPEDWFPEEQDEIDGTHELYDILRNLLNSGYRVDIVDCWSGTEDEDAKVLDVSLSRVPMEHFRLFEGFLFDLGL